MNSVLVPATLDRRFRVRSQTHFKHVFENAGKVENGYVRIFFSPAMNEFASVAFVASKRVGNAVVRNASKRRLRELYRHHRHHLATGYDMILVAKHRLMLDSYALVEKQFINLMVRNKLWSTSCE